MRNNLVFNYDMLFSDHFKRVSDKAKWYYVNLMFHADNGFVSNPLSLLDSMGDGYTKDVLIELIKNEDVLTLPDRCEIFITSYFVHTHFKPMSWLSSPFSIYWKGKLFLKKNGVATFKPQKEETVEPKAEEEPILKDKPQVEEKPVINSVDDYMKYKGYEDIAEMTEKDNQFIDNLLKDRMTELKHNDLPLGMTEDTTFQEWYGVEKWSELTPEQQKEWLHIWCCD